MLVYLPIREGWYFLSKVPLFRRVVVHPHVGCVVGVVLGVTRTGTEGRVVTAPHEPGGRSTVDHWGDGKAETLPSLCSWSLPSPLPFTNNCTHVREDGVLSFVIATLIFPVYGTWTPYKRTFKVKSFIDF